jgi:hypothetical protein
MRLKKHISNPIKMLMSFAKNAYISNTKQILYSTQKA